MVQAQDQAADHKRPKVSVELPVHSTMIREQCDSLTNGSHVGSTESSRRCAVTSLRNENVLMERAAVSLTIDGN